MSEMGFIQLNSDNINAFILGNSSEEPTKKVLHRKSRCANVTPDLQSLKLNASI